MAKSVAAVDIEINGGTAINSMRDLKKALKDANFEVFQMREKFGETSTQAIEAAKKVAGIKDAIGDAKAMSDSFNPDAKFKALSETLSVVAGGFAAVQGAQALLGSESEDLQKALVKVQGAMALSQGISELGKAGDAFKNLKAVVLETYGAGNAPAEKGFIAPINAAIKKGIIVVNITQCRAGAVQQGRYETSTGLQKIGVISVLIGIICGGCTPFVNHRGAQVNEKVLQKIKINIDT